MTLTYKRLNILVNNRIVWYANDTEDAHNFVSWLERVGLDVTTHVVDVNYEVEGINMIGWI